MYYFSLSACFNLLQDKKRRSIEVENAEIDNK